MVSLLTALRRYHKIIPREISQISPGHSHQSSRNDGARNDEPKTRNDILDAFLHCGNKIVPVVPIPERSFPERGTLHHFRSAVTKVQV